MGFYISEGVRQVLVSKINNTAFRGYRRVADNTGHDVYNFSYPYDSKEQSVKIEFYKPNAKAGDSPVKTIELNNTNSVNFDEIPELRNEDIIPYRVYLNGKHVADSGFIPQTKTQDKDLT